MRQSSGWIASPDYDLDGMYDSNMDCQWFVIANNGSVISFQVLYVEIQYHKWCIADFLWVNVTENKDNKHERKHEIW